MTKQCGDTLSGEDRSEIRDSEGDSADITGLTQFGSDGR